jgi:3'-phosphoadenosine 5'-phosphosulfate (PAPS) 3'-phosphatase
MDIGLQVSLSETFNIVAADLISQGVPVVGTTEIPWMNHMYCADPTETQEIYNTLKLVHEFPQLNVHANKHGLKHYTNKTKDIWENYFKHEQHEKEKS